MSALEERMQFRIDNLPVTMSEEQARGLVGQYGPVRALDLHRKPEGRMPCREAVVTMDDADAEMAVRELDEMRIGAHVLLVHAL
jgi:hypothetical protein